MILPLDITVGSLPAGSYRWILSLDLLLQAALTAAAEAAAKRKMATTAVAVAVPPGVQLQIHATPGIVDRKAVGCGWGGGWRGVKARAISGLRKVGEFGVFVVLCC